MRGWVPAAVVNEGAARAGTGAGTVPHNTAHQHRYQVGGALLSIQVWQERAVLACTLRCAQTQSPLPSCKHTRCDACGTTLPQERAFLACTLRDTKSVIGKLERLLGAIMHVLFCFFYLYIFGVSCGACFGMLWSCSC